MKISFWSTKAQVSLLVGLASPFIFQTNRVSAMTSTVAYYRIEQTTPVSKIIAVQKINPTTVEIVYDNNQRLTLDFYGNHIFRMFQDIHGGIIRDPEENLKRRSLSNSHEKQWITSK